jgi:lysozyme family protein
MTATNREASILETLRWEGGYSNDPGDSGGPTNWGITIWDARKYWRPTATAADVRVMPRSVAVDIYRDKYWKTAYYDCDHLNAGVDLAVFDYGVNSGPSRARRALMASIGGPSPDTIKRVCAYRMTFLHNLSIWRLFGRGWARRVAGIQVTALKMATADPNPPPPNPTLPVPPTPTKDATMPFIINWKTTAAGAALIATSLLHTFFGIDIPGFTAPDLGTAVIAGLGLAFAKDATASK